MKRRILSVLCSIVLLSMLFVTVFALEIPDFDRSGSISVSMVYRGTAVPGGNLTLYRVADVIERDADYSFRYTQEFAECEYPLNDLSSPQIAEALAQIVVKDSLAGTVMRISSSGMVTFSDLEIGLYLLVQETAADGFNAVDPFLVSVPNRVDGHYVYDVDASPKVELEPAPTTEPTDPTTTTTKPPELPQTGQNNWPVPALLAAGLLFVVVGCYLHISGKGKKHEA